MDELCAISKGNFALFTSKTAKKMGILAENDLMDLERFIGLESKCLPE